jgi:(2Fe-2S) ferredoxin
MSNSGMRENTYKLGFTQNDPINRARQLYTEGVIEPFVIEFAKKVLFQKEKFQMIANILDEHDYRISKDRTFYRCEIDEIRNIFTIIKGVWYIPVDEDKDEEYENVNDENEDTVVDKMIIDEEVEPLISGLEEEEEEDDTPPQHVMKNVFHDGQAIRHNVDWFLQQNK